MSEVLPGYGEYVVSAYGTFGTVEREYVTEGGEPCVVIRWGPLRWLTPVRARDCKRVQSRAEARAWLEELAGR